MKRYHFFVFILITGVLLAACNSSLVEPEIGSSPLPAANVDASPAVQEPVSAPVEVIKYDEIDGEQVEESSANQTLALWPDGEVKLDEQGFVEVAVTPLNLNAPDGTLAFNVGLETHSVDLSMDLASLATLQADNGLGVQAILWDAPSGGHHISGVLSFPVDSDGATLLEGASKVTLIIRDVDASERSFTWSLTG